MTRESVLRNPAYFDVARIQPRMLELEQCVAPIVADGEDDPRVAVAAAASAQ
ncbi:MAG TPA: hypothetical protein VGC96_00445 [Candidatus Elarobacter sp.]